MKKGYVSGTDQERKKTRLYFEWVIASSLLFIFHWICICLYVAESKNSTSFDCVFTYTSCLTSYDARGVISLSLSLFLSHSHSHSFIELSQGFLWLTLACQRFISFSSSSSASSLFPGISLQAVFYRRMQLNQQSKKRVDMKSEEEQTDCKSCVGGTDRGRETEWSCDVSFSLSLHLHHVFLPSFSRDSHVCLTSLSFFLRFSFVFLFVWFVCMFVQLFFEWVTTCLSERLYLDHLLLS